MSATPPPFDEARAVELVTRYQSGQEGALADLYRFLEPAIWTGLRRYRSASLPATLTRQDVSQQCWIILADLAQRWRPQGSFLGYFFHTFPHALQRFVQRQPFRQTVEVMMPHDEVMATADQVREEEPVWETKLGWEDLLVRIPAAERQAFVLHSGKGETFASIAEALGVSRATAYRLYQRALARLSNEFDASDGGPSSDADPESDIVRLVHALHAGASPSGTLLGRRGPNSPPDWLAATMLT